MCVMERAVLEIDPACLRDAVSVPFVDSELVPPEVVNSLCELLASMRDGKVVAVLRDLETYDRTGRMTSLIDDTLRRAQCLADADRIIEKFSH